MLILIFVSVQVLNAQSKELKKEFRSVISSDEKSRVNNSLLLKADLQGRIHYNDQDGDKIIVLDYKTRKNLKDVSSYKSEGPINEKLYASNFYKAESPDVGAEEKKAEINYYITNEGDSWESISLKLYDNNIYSNQLKIWNEDLLKDLTIPAGSTIKYWDLPKK